MIVKVLVAGLCATLARSLRARQRLLMLTFLASNPSRCRRRPSLPLVLRAPVVSEPQLR
jgi:hypothetical protein